MKILFLLLLVAISLFVILKSKGVKTEKDFTVANRKLNSIEITYVIMGTLSGGVATIGTVQMAYMYGISAWIFTLFSGVACLILGLFFTKALRSSEYTTISEFIGNKFGSKARIYTSILSSFGIFIHIVAQFLASISIIETVFGFNSISSITLTFILILIFVLSGGIISSISVGKIKIFMLYSLMIFSTLVALNKQQGILNMVHHLPNKNMLNFFAYGKAKAIQDMIAMVIGILSTQIYIQAIFSAKNIKAARNGAIFSAILAPPIGLMAVIIGIYMRIHHPELINNTVIVFPYFLKLYLNPILTAIFLSFLAIITLGSASGLTLGVTTNIYEDIFKKLNTAKKMKEINSIKAIGFVVLSLSTILVITGLHSTILSWSYLSMGIRGSVIFIPMMFIMLIKDDEILKKLKPIIFIAPIVYIIVSIITK